MSRFHFRWPEAAAVARLTWRVTSAAGPRNMRHHPFLLERPTMPHAKVTSKVTAIETLSCDAGWRNYHFVKLTTDDGITRLVRIRRGLWRAGSRHGHQQARGPRHRPAGRRAREDLRRALFDHAAGGRRRRRAGAGRHRERAARCQGQGAGRAVLRAARRQGARQDPRVLVALRDVAHQSSDLLQAGDHRSRGHQGDGPRSAREGVFGAQDQHLPV